LKTLCAGACLLAVAAFAPPASCQRTAPAARGIIEFKPDTLGFSPQRLERVHTLLEREVEDKEFAGFVTLLARHGKIVDFRTYGKRDLASGAPMEKDTIFRIYSMTKPVIGVAMMILYEQGKWSPGDPVSKHIPEFTDLQVYRSTTPEGRVVTEPLLRAPTMADLMGHTAGFAFGAIGTNSPVDKMYRDADVFGAANLQQMIGRLARLPLLYQPGTRWVYGIASDIQGYLVEKLSGRPLGVFLKENLYDPLGMKDTAFYADRDRLRRLATLYSMNSGGLKPDSGASVLGIDFTKDPSLPLGGAGLLSTASDYFRFSQMLLNGGELDGVRLLAPSSVELMRTNRLPEALRVEFGATVGLGSGFGFDFGVYTDPGFTGRTVGRGTFTWAGAAGTWFWIDPANDIVFVGLTQRLMSGPDMNTLSQGAVYQALVNPEK
jgi:CubicO group peptidase (beta-lactamase class C family)